MLSFKWLNYLVDDYYSIIARDAQNITTFVKNISGINYFFIKALNSERFWSVPLSLDTMPLSPDAMPMSPGTGALSTDAVVRS
jgi:hypothetical protein